MNVQFRHLNIIFILILHYGIPSSAKADGTRPAQPLTCPKAVELKALTRPQVGGQIVHKGTIFKVHHLQGKIDLSVIEDIKGPDLVTHPQDLRQLNLRKQDLACVYKRFLFGRIYGALILTPLT